MHPDNELLTQDVLKDNEQIHRRISDELAKAQTQVLVAMAWFTDPDLYRSLLDLAHRGIDVRIVLAGNEDNKKLDFDKLKRAGAQVNRVDNKRYGGMRHRFCVIDRKLAIYGTNWTVNARINNQESVMITNYADTVASLVSQYEELEAMFVQTKQWRIHWRFTFFTWRRKKPQEQADPSAEDIPTRETSAVPQSPGHIQDITDFRSEYSEVLNGMVAVEIGQFDRELLRQQGEERAAATNGDAQLLGNALDSVYASFINDINVVEDKKTRLTGKIQEQRILYDGMLERNYQAELHQLASQAETSRSQINTRMAALKTKTGIYESEVELIRHQKIVTAEKEEHTLEAQVLHSDQAGIRPGFKWHEFIPVLLFGLGLLAYLFLFYSSAVYILLYSERDALEAQQSSGAYFIPPQVFEARALDRVFQEGAYAICFVFLFVFVPLALMASSRLAKNTILSRTWVAVLLALTLDAGIAYKVAASIHNAMYITGQTTVPWQPLLAFTEPNFYLVFLLGSLGLLIFHALFNKLLNLFEERTPDTAQKQLELRKVQEKQTLEKHRNYISLLQDRVENCSRTLLQTNHDLQVAEQELIALPLQETKSLEKARLDLENNRKVLHDVTAVYIARIENDRLPVSIDALHDRINIFLDGWTRFLNREYAEARASEKTRQAKEEVARWWDQRIDQRLIDHRIKRLS